MIDRRQICLAVGVSLSGLTSCGDPGMAVNSRPLGEAVPMGVDLGTSIRAPSRIVRDAAMVSGRDTPAGGLVQPVRDEPDVPATGVVNSVSTAQKRINLSHQPIPAIGWPAMTMDFPVAPSVDLSAVKPGSRVDITLRKGKDGMYEIRSVQSAAR